MARADLEALNADYNNFGIPRNVTDLLAIDDDLLHEKMIVDSRCDAELLTVECFEQEGKLLRKISKKSHMLEVGCSNKECQDLRVVWRRMQTTGKWKLSKFVWVHSCGNKVIPAWEVVVPQSVVCSNAKQTSSNQGRDATCYCCSPWKNYR
jgi:hypothetical protein